MANIKISELNELLTGQKAYDDYLPIVDASADETKKISVKALIPSNVKIIAVTDTEPTEYNSGDKYYNTDENRIYTAVSSGWINPEEPIQNIFYVNIGEQVTYTYDRDNQTLVSVGGGSGSSDIVMVDSDTPTEETKLYIESTDLDFQGLEISNTYTTGNNISYSADYINSAFGGTILWTNPDPTSAFAGQEITLNSSDYDVYEIVYTAARSSDNRNYTSGKIRKGIRYNALFVATVQATPSMVARGMTDITATTMTFGSGYAGTVSSMSSSNDVAVPLYVIGYKTGLFS